ncbi:putative 2-aminoethylphosphonate--pyruvate transaminase [Megalodesulfovibrio gigas DSM 1382 = ATCC 19364]|uniref:2-aminoethylphosphonate--pyruvate transaminase n=1 Tax=Megalodesulfovibrio gigas (strain ATCC 19364 / DSM 1382 / NCIMB 9332 / VKM B-1759) TaxID=1121448 RepID=T2G978_MEGG1|nr:2-aminoethylphosphonate--pyruvate transaminase [Megalodesulfovibrio gigas]AGW12671.1 putative 2-aminoethylphosphonate--pyruvate transaminase [Megalodesulfovibrio gigas DSM 1382 = ATCC 19364]
MDLRHIPDNPYLLLTPGPLSTSKRVRAALFRDWCTWDDDYNGIVQLVRASLARLATEEAASDISAVLMQGSGTFSVEATIGTAVPEHGVLLVLANGAYGRRIAQIAARLHLNHLLLESPETAPPDPERLRQTLAANPAISHVAVVHCETTTGMLNPVAAIGEIVKEYGKVFIVDAMSSFGGLPMTLDAIHADFLISSANKCIQGIPGFGFVLARRAALEACAGQARSLSLDLHSQWKEMEDKGGKWRYTSPTHAVRAFAEALAELEDEGGVPARHARYVENQRLLVEGMAGLGFTPLLARPLQSPVITAFLSPTHPTYDFRRFYDLLKARGYVIYPGKVSDADTFRIGTIGHVFSDDVLGLLAAVSASMYWQM